MYYTICTVTTRMARAKLWMFGKLLKLTLNEKIATILPKGKKIFQHFAEFHFSIIFLEICQNFETFGNFSVFFGFQFFK